MGRFLLGAGVLRRSRALDRRASAANDFFAGDSVGSILVGDGMALVGAIVAVLATPLHAATTLLDRAVGPYGLGGNVSGVRLAALSTWPRTRHARCRYRQGLGRGGTGNNGRADRPGDFRFARLRVAMDGRRRAIRPELSPPYDNAPCPRNRAGRSRHQPRQ